MSNSLNNISPIDGRYSKITQELKHYFSESALIRYRVYIEIEYFISLYYLPLKELSNLKKNDINNIREIYSNIKEADIQRIKEIEKTTNHDVKAVEYFIKEKFDTLKLDAYKEFIHFGLTSQDINNTATPLLLMEGLNNCIYRQINILIEKLSIFCIIGFPT